MTDSPSQPSESSPTRSPQDRPPLDTPNLLPYLPMLYVAWSDGDLSVEEASQICPDLDPHCQGLVAPWLDPEQPPSAVELQRMLRRVRVASKDLDTAERLDLSGLGLEIAQADHRISRPERRALERLQDALGVGGTEAARQLLASRRPARREREPAPTFDVDAMTDRLAGRHAEVRARVLSILAGPEFAYLEEPTRAEYRQRVLEWLQILADEGLGGLSFPAEHGGAGDLGGFITAFETLAFFDLSLLVKFGVQFGLWGGSVANLGTKRHHAELLPKIASLEMPGCFAMTETSHGSNVADLETTARFLAASDEFEVTTPHRGARKNYIGNAALHGRWATVFAQLELPDPDDAEAWQTHGVHAVVVPIRDDAGRPLPGVSIGDDGPKMGLNGVDNGWLELDRVRVPRSALLDRFAEVSADGEYTSAIASPSKRFFTVLGTLVGGRVSVALGALSVAKSALTIAVRYGVRRRQFGPPGETEIAVLDYPTHQRRLLPRVATTYALHFALHDLRDRYVQSMQADDRREVEALAAGLKAWATWHATESVQTGREACGGQGYLAENRFARLKADSDVFTTFEGDNMVLLQLVGKSLLADLRRQFHDMNVLGLVRYAARRAGSVLSEQNPLAVRNTDREHLRSRDFHLAAFRWREQHLVTTLGSRLKKLLDGGMESHEAVLECQHHLVEASKAHVEHVVLQRFIDAIAATNDTAVRTQLEQLCDLFALARLEAGATHFLEHGYIDGSKSRAITEQVTALCGEVRPQALHLVDGFGIPEKLLGAAIAR
ncbi:MAG: acyl-CoA dehydrogenase [Acidobacteriota bacterium]